MNKILSIITGLIVGLVISSIPAHASDGADKVTRKIHSALQCVSKFGQVSGVTITGAEKSGDGYSVNGVYAMSGFWGQSPGVFEAKVDSSLDLTYMKWTEPNNSAVAPDSCLN